MLFGETVAVCCENRTEHTDTLCGQSVPHRRHTDTLCGQSAEIWHVKGAGTQYPLCLMGLTKVFQVRSSEIRNDDSYTDVGN
jgi:hypothetical protein